MSLRVRLILLSAVLVALVVVAFSALYLNNLVNSLSGEALDRGMLLSSQINSFMIDRLNQQAEVLEVPASEDLKAFYDQIIANDHDINTMLVRMMAPFPNYILEINVASEGGGILASSNPNRVGTSLMRYEDFAQWGNRPLVWRVWDLVTRRQPNFEVVARLLGIQETPLFTIQVVTSGVLLRETLVPDLRKLAAVSGGSFLGALLITVLATARVLRPLKRIEQTIDRIVQGSYGGEAGKIATHRDQAREFAAVESKLDLLGQQYRGARENASELRHNVDQLIERMASQLDVATRLAAISRITGGVAHEIKNPLNAIALRLDLVREKLGAPEEELAPELDILSKEVLRLDRVVKTFLDFSRPVEVHLREVDLAALTRDAAELMMPPARHAQIDLKLNLPATPAFVRADPDMLKQVILNLVTNAMEAMKEGGRLGLTVAITRDIVALEVSDSGPGIPEDLRDKVFQLYFTTKTRGSGIGLAMTYRAVQLHNGTISFTTEEGRGTTFRIQFPVAVRHA